MSSPAPTTSATPSIDHDGRQGRHQRAGCSGPGARRLERRRPHHRHHRLLPPRRQRLLRRHRLVDRRPVRDPRLQLPGPRRLHRLRRRRHPHLHTGDADRAERRQAGHRPQPGAPQLGRHQLHPHLRRGRSDRRRADGQRCRCFGRWHAELRRRRRLHDRPPHRLHRRDLRPRSIDIDARAGPARRGRVLGLRRPDDDRRHPRPERSRHRLLPLSCSPASTTSATPSRSRRSSRSTRSAPAAPGLVLADSSADVHTTGTTAFYRPAGSGSFDVTASSTDAESGVLDYGFPVLAGFTGSGAGATRTYTLATPTEPNGAKPVTARNQALLSSAATNFTLTADSAVPASGALTVNTVAASGGGTQSYDSDGTFTIGLRTDYTDAASGLASSTLTREQGTLNADACSAYGAPTTLVGTPGPERSRHRLLPLRPHRHRQRRQHRLDHHDRQGRHDRAGRPRPGARRLQRRRPHHRHHRLLPARRQRLLRRHRLVDRRHSPGSSTTASRPSPASPAPAPAPPAPTHWRRRPSRTAPSRSPPATRRCSARPPPTSPSPPTPPHRPAAR